MPWILQREWRVIVDRKRALFLHFGATMDMGLEGKVVLEGDIPLLVKVENADIIATLIKLKGEVEGALANKDMNSTKIRVTLVGATEAHLLASEIAEAGVGVIVAPIRPFPGAWESLRIFPGPPLSEKTAVSKLLEHNVTVAIASDPSQTWATRNTRWDIAWIALDSQGALGRLEALELASTKVEELSGLNVKDADDRDLVVTRSGGELLEFEGKMIGVVSGKRGVVDFF